MKSRTVTIKDIAKALGISASTVSRALKDHPDISIETKRQVTELAQKLKYRPNPIALSLKNQRSNVIAVIVPEIVHHFFSSVISGIETAAEENGLQVMISQSFESFEREMLLCEIFKNSFVEGVIISVSKETNTDRHIKELQDAGIPVIFFDRVIENAAIDRIVINDFDGAYQATRHLIEQGCKNIIHFAGPKTRQISINRMNGFKKALEEANLPITKASIIECDSYSKAQETLHYLLGNHIQFDGVFAVNDLTALGTINKLMELNISVPEQVAVVGFGNDPISQIFNPTLSSVNQPGHEMGHKAVSLLLSRIEKEGEDDFQNVVLETQLIVRKSSTRK